MCQRPSLIQTEQSTGSRNAAPLRRRRLILDNHRDVLTNPTVIFEVLSRSTAAYDRGEKSLRYRTHISSLQDLILVAQDKPHIEHYSRQQDGTWAQTEIDGLDALLILDSIDCQLSLAELYAGIVFPEQTAS